MKRLFVAAVLPEQALAALLALQQGLAERALSLKLTAPDNLHLTLRFVGNCEEGQVQALQGWFSGLTLPRRQEAGCRLLGLGAFARRDGLLVYGDLQLSQALLTLQKQMEQGLRQEGFAPETRPFVPHITLAKKVKLRYDLDQGSRTDAPDFFLHRLVLFESRLGPGGADYLPLAIRDLENT